MSGSGFRRTLPTGGVLWWQGDPASSLAVIEQGCVGVRAGGRLLDAAIPGTVLGEAALLAAGGDTPGRRTADVVALMPDSVVTEYPAAVVSGLPGEGLPATVLRTLFYQVARNVLLVRTACRGDAFLRAATQGLIDAAGRAHARVDATTSGDEFLAAFRFAYRLRECSDAMRAELAPAGSWSVAHARSALDEMRAAGVATELTSAVGGFVDLWASLPESG